MIGRAYEIESIHLALMAARGKVVIDLTSPENMGGRWLNAVRIAREKLRRAAVKAARKAKLK